jgi:serine/threonine protein kinase
MGHAGLGLDSMSRMDEQQPSELDLQTRLIGSGSRALDRVGNYTLVRLIGEGAMGSVYLAHHQQFTHRYFAIKLLKAEAPQPEVIQRFEREIEVTGKLRHPNLIYAQDAGVSSDGHLYLVMEFVEGIDLQKLVSLRKRLSVGDATALVCQACSGIGYAHELGIVHRDIKPSNLLVDRKGNLKVSDLGLAAIAEKEADMMATQAHSVLGTPHFMAPELWEDARTASIASDVYALGCTYYSLLSGAPPFAAHKGTSALIRAHEHELPAFSGEVWEGVPAEVIGVIDHCLRKRAFERVESAEALRRAIEGFSSQQVVIDETAAPETARNFGTIQVGNSDTQRQAVPRSVVSPIVAASAAPRAATPSPADWAKPYDDSSPSKWSINTQPRPILGRVLSAIGILLAISTLSLTMAYYGPSATEAWHRRYDLLRDSQVPSGAGFAIELFRAVLFLSLTISVLSFRFTREIRMLVSLRDWKWKLLASRLVILAIVVLFVGIEVNRHLDPTKAAAELAKWGQERGIATTPQQEVGPYRWYLGYSVINYVVVLGGLIAFPFARFVLSDCGYALRQFQNMRARIASLTSASAISKQLLTFGVECRELAARYVDVLATLVVGVHYDWWIGWKTLSESAFMVMVTGWIVVALGTGFLLAITWIYTRAYDEAAKRVAIVGGVTEEAEIARLNAMWFIQRILFGSFGGLVCLSIWIVLLNSMLRR